MLTLAIAASVSARAQSPQEFEALRQQVQRLIEEVNVLKKAKSAEPVPTEPALLSARVEKLEKADASPSKGAVVAGDLPGSFRFPGSNTSVRFYGYAEVHGIHDLKASGPSDLFTDLSSQPLDNSGEQKGRTRFTAETSRLGFESATPIGANALNTKLEMDFYSYGSNNRNRLRLRHAYGEYGGWLIGQTWSTFMDLDDLPETVDFNGPIGAPFSRRTMVRYTYGDTKAGYKFSVAAEDPEDQFGGGSSKERLPQLIARYDQSFAWGAVNVRALAHEKRSATETKRGFGFAVGGNYKLTEKDVLMGQYTRVNGDVDQLYGSNGYTIAANGAITFDKNEGLVVGYARTFSDQLRGTVAYGMNRGKTAEALGNRQLQQLFVNAIYSPIKNVELGAEFIYGKRKTFAGDTGTMSRFDLMGRYSF